MSDDDSIFPSMRRTWRDRKENGLCGTLSGVIHYFTCYGIFIPLILMINLANKFPCSRKKKIAREIKRDMKAIDTYFTENVRRPASENPISRLSTADATDFFFGKLPPEIRRSILICAFGERTLHMHLISYAQWDFTKNVRDIEGQAHARFDKRCRPDLRKPWMWYGCVCHRGGPEKNPLSFGRLRRWPDWPVGPDSCLMGEGNCIQWPGEWPSKCQVGILGWLLSCRQAYWEGMDVLYRTNTIQMSSACLLRGMQDILSITILRSLTSLELVWKQIRDGSISLESGFIGYKDQKKYDREDDTPRPILPSLQFLRIHLTTLPPPGKYIDEGRVPPGLDSIITKLAPPAADVTVSFNWSNWFKATESLQITEQGGSSAGRQTLSEFGGSKVWRQIPVSNEDKAPTPGNLEQGARTRGNIQGYWLHNLDGSRLGYQGK